MIKLIFITLFYKDSNSMGNSPTPSDVFDVSRHQTTKVSPFHNETNGWQIYLTVSSQEEQLQMINILSKRIENLSKNMYVCSIKSFEVQDFMHERSIITKSCKYNAIGYRLCEVPLEQYPNLFTTTEIYNFICCACQGLLAFRKAHLYYGDLYMDNLCKTGKYWQIIDKDFMKYGLSAYETVLEGEAAFITPSQMQRIRHGFIRESPLLQQSDDIFALGMIILQLGSCLPSKDCYQRSFTRFNEQNIEKHLNALQNRHNSSLCNLVRKMLDFEQDYRIKLDELVVLPYLNTCKRISLQKSGSRNSPRKNNQLEAPLKSRENMSTELIRSRQTMNGMQYSRDNSAKSQYNQNSIKKSQKQIISEQSISNHLDLEPVNMLKNREKSLKILPSAKQIYYSPQRNPFQFNHPDANFQKSLQVLPSSRGTPHVLQAQIRRGPRAASLHLQRNYHQHQSTFPPHPYLPQKSPIK